jgi:hypothetical protein
MSSSLANMILYLFSSFHKVCNDLIIEELTKDLPLRSDATTNLYSSTP